jgi:hypothetical protein
MLINLNLYDFNKCKTNPNNQFSSFIWFDLVHIFLKRKKKSNQLELFFFIKTKHVHPCRTVLDHMVNWDSKIMLTPRIE